MHLRGGKYHCYLKQFGCHLASQKSKKRSIAFLAVPLVLVAFTHLWNPSDFPRVHPDEGYYIGRSIHVSDGFGPKEESAGYDHPYLGWLFLGSIFNIIGYPESANPTPGDANSIATVWLFPRMVMGILSVADTLLIYKIAEIRYNRNVALIAAILFAVMPYTWLIRRALIEPIQLPFLLTSILLALYSGIKPRKTEERSENLVKVRSQTEEYELTRNTAATSEKAAKGEREGNEGYYNAYMKIIISNQNIILLLSSGIFLGLTVFTKIPAITLIPLIGFIVFTNNKKSFKALGIWIIPVILIPLMWPIHALYAGELDEWHDGITRHITRNDKPLLGAIDFFYKEDRVLLILGLASFVFVAVTKKDFIFLVWVLPFLALLYVVNYVSTFHLIPLIPAFCIGTAVMIKDVSDKITDNKISARRILPLTIVSIITILGLTITTSMIVKTMNSADFDVIALVTKYMPASNGNAAEQKSNQIMNGKNEPVTVVARDPYKFWIFKYVFDKLGYDYKTPLSMIGNATLENAKDGSGKILIIADETMRKVVTGTELPRTSKAEIKADRISYLYNYTRTVEKNHNVEIRTNY